MNEKTMASFVGEDHPQTPVARSDMERAVQEVQAALVIAQRFPRNERLARDNIMIECSRPALAAQASFQFPRGGQSVSGPSIRMAESAARHWGNMEYGIRELERTDDGSQMEAFAWDLQTNTRVRREFFAPNIRWTKTDGAKLLEDPRDLYENNANLGARRVRACILELIPGDVIDAAMAKAQETLKANVDTSADGIQKAVAVFSRWGVSADHIAARYRKNIEALTAGELVDLRKIANSLKDGMSKPADWFEMAAASKPENSATVEAFNEALEKDPNAGYTKTADPQNDKPPMVSGGDDGAAPFMMEAEQVNNLITAMDRYDLDTVNTIIADIATVPKDRQKEVLKAATDRKNQLEGGVREDI